VGNKQQERLLTMKVEMPWLKARLRELHRTPAGLARHLGIQGPRVYEMIGGRRAIQPDEIEPTAEFLDWSVEQLLEQLPEEARVIPHRIAHNPGKGMLPVLGTTREWTTTAEGKNYDMLLTGETTHYLKSLPALNGRVDVACLYLHGTGMCPWREPGELVLIEYKRPPRDHDHVVIYLTAKDNGPVPVLVRQLVRQVGGKLRVRQHNPLKESDIDLKRVASMYRVLTWDDVVR
jgi:hypothetical protein